MFLILEVRFFQCMRISVSAVGGHLLTWKRVGFLLLFFNFGKLFSFYEISFHLIFFIIPRIGQKGFHFFFACQLVSSFNKCPWQQMDGGEGKGEASQASYFVWTRSRNMHKLILFYSNRSKFKSAKRRERNTSCPLCHTEPLAGSESGSGSEFEFETEFGLVAKTRKGFQLRRVYGQDRSRNRSWAQLPTVVLQLAMNLPLTLTKKQLSPHFK